MEEPKFNHALSISFEVINNSEHDVSNSEIITALKEKITELEGNPRLAQAATDIFDTFKIAV